MLRDASDGGIACVNQGNASAQPIDDQIYSLAQNWHPSDYFDTSSLRQAVAAVQAVLSSAFDLSSNAHDSCFKAPGCSDSWYLGDYAKLSSAASQSQVYLQTADATDSAASTAFKTAYVAAPGFKDWALDALQAASNAVTDAAVTNCLMPWWASAVVHIRNAADAAAAVLSSILGVAADVVETAFKGGQAIVQTAAETFHLLSWTLGNLPLIIGAAALIFGGSYVWLNRDKLKAGMSRLKRGTAS